MSLRRRYELVLAIYPNTRGFAFALFEGPLSPVDWGVVEVRGKAKNRRCLQRISMLFGRYQPKVLVLQDMSEGGTSRASRIQRLNDAIDTLAATQGIPVLAYSRDRVRQFFELQFGIRSKQAIAEIIAHHVPVFERFVPPQRKPWMSEDSRMGIFDAVALMLTFFNSNQGVETIYGIAGSS